MNRKKSSIEIRLDGPHEGLSLSFDPEAQALYIRVREGKVARTVEVEDGVTVDLSPSGLPIGIELLKPARPDVLDRIARDFGIPGVAEVSTLGEVAGMFAPA